MSQDAAPQERAKLLFDEAGRGLIPAARTREKAFQLFSDDLVKKSFLRLVALVVGHGVSPRDRRGERRKTSYAGSVAVAPGMGRSMGRVACGVLEA